MVHRKILAREIILLFITVQTLTNKKYIQYQILANHTYRQKLLARKYKLVAIVHIVNMPNIFSVSMNIEEENFGKYTVAHNLPIFSHQKFPVYGM